MTSADSMRASDGDRERVVAALQEQVGEGRLTLLEFEQRTNEAYAAKTVGDLRALTTDLPVDPLGPPALPHPFDGPFPMAAVPPWVQRPYPSTSGGPHPPIRRVSPLALAGSVFLTLFVVQAVVGAIVLHTLVIAPFVPLLILAFVFLRGGGGRRRYR